MFLSGGATLVSAGAHIYIGNNVMFGPNVSIVTGNHRTDIIGKYMIDVKEKKETDDQDVIIEDDVWIGMGAIVLKGVTIGKGSVIGAGALITKDVSPYSIVTRQNQMNVRKRFCDEDVKKHEKLLEKNK